jgi:hypothetical protein
MFLITGEHSEKTSQTTPHYSVAWCHCRGSHDKSQGPLTNELCPGLE